ncbi:MAG: glycosyltransferase [Magnetococcales bacterium]|nr:glycosyltransferase [Magnetococcales bacterium]
MIQSAVILAGGQGSRVSAKHKDRNLIKVLLPINEKSVLLENIEIIRDRLHIRSILIIVGYQADEVQKQLGTGEAFGVRLEYIQADVEKGLIDALMLARNKIQGHFLLLLGDGFYLNCNHESLNALDMTQIDGVVTYIRHHDPQGIASNFSIQLGPKGQHIAHLEEKPQTVENDLVGLGTFVLNPEIFDYFKKVEVNPKTGNREFIDAISHFAEDRRVVGHELTGHYVNINTTDDWYFAQFLARRAAFDETRKSLVIPTHNEGSSILFVLHDFHQHVDEIVVADGGSSDDTVAKVESFKSISKCPITILTGPFQGYGDALRNGTDAATGQIVIFVEADATFRSRDLHKILEYLKDCDMAIGTRTTRQMISQGANMAGWLRLGNVMAAKVIEMLWWVEAEPRLTDVGCTYRAFWKNRYDDIKHNFISLGPDFSPELMVEFIRNNNRIIEVPVSYYRRQGGMSKHSRGFWGVFKTAWRMMVLVFKKRFFLPL